MGKFKLLHQGHQYALTVIDVLTNYTWYIQLPSKGAYEVVHTYIINTCSKLGGWHNILSGNGTELRNK